MPPAGVWPAPPLPEFLGETPSQDTDTVVRTGRDDLEDAGYRFPVRSRGSDADPQQRGEAERSDAGSDRWRGRDMSDFTGEVTGAIPGAPAPISAVSSTSGMTHSSVRDRADSALGSDGAGQNGGAGTPSAVAAAPSTEYAQKDPWESAGPPMSDREAFPEASAPVSAVAAVPGAGGPRPARMSVSAFHERPEIPEDGFDETVIARRRRVQWSLLPPLGEPIPLRAETVILGRKPSADPDHPGAQLISIQDGTVSKTHARLSLRDDRWYVIDLDSTNGVLFATLMGTEVEAPRGVEVEAGDRFLLGDAEVRLQRRDG